MRVVCTHRQMRSQVKQVEVVVRVEVERCGKSRVTSNKNHEASDRRQAGRHAAMSEASKELSPPN